MDLGGNWRAVVANDELRRSFALPETDDSLWSQVPVPGHWRSSRDFAANDDPVLYRTTFVNPAIGNSDTARTWLGFEGIFYQGDVWLDGRYLGATEGYFAPHTFEVTDALRAHETPRTHVLGVEVTCSPQRSRTAKRNLTGVFQHGDSIEATWNPGGIWRPVSLFTTGPVRITRLRVVCVEANCERAVLAVRAVLDATSTRSVRIRSSVGSTLDEQEHQLASGSNRVEWKVTVERPLLWWPHALGEPNLTEVAIEVIDLATDTVSDERRRRTGLRQVRRHDWIWEINGERLHLKGANVGPTRMAIGDATPEELRRDVELARDIGLDLLRVQAHVTHPAFYAAADELGMLVWQDMPLQRGYARSVRKQALTQAGELVDLLGHHPSIIHWCGHNEPLPLDVDQSAVTGTKKSAEIGTRYLLAQEVPTWNKSVLDWGIHRALAKADSSRPVTAHSGVLPGPTSPGTDTHVFFGWYHGHERDFPTLARNFPRLARFVSEFGAQAVPETDGFIVSQSWPDLDWERLAREHSAQTAFFERNVAPSASVHYDDWKRATQLHQATVLRRHIEELRRIKYRPNGGFTFLSLYDALDYPAITWSVLGHDRRPKLAYSAVAEACRPVIVTADRPPAVVSVNEALSLDVHVVSDVRHVLRNAEVTAVIRWPGGSHRWHWSGDIAADAVTRVGAVDIVLPSPAHPSSRTAPQLVAAEAEFVLELALTHPETTASNRYTARFV